MARLEIHKTPPTVALRPPADVMRLARLGCLHQTRLSFMRALLRQLRRDRWRFERTFWEIDGEGVGTAIYSAQGPDRCYSLVAFSHDLDPSRRTDRVIAEAWDATFALYDGVPDAAEIERLAANVPLQEAGTYKASDLILSRANKSVRLFEHVTDALANGRQPDPATLDSVGYLMRTTAVYGNGKFGIADRDRIADRPEFAAPFRAEMLSVWLIRAFTVDLADHLAACRGGARAVPLDTAIRRRLGVGNSTGLGLGPFIANHPALFDRWITAREMALARVRALSSATAEERERFERVLRSAQAEADGWHVADPRQTERIAGLRRDLVRLRGQIDAAALDKDSPWDALHRWAQDALTMEGQELLVGLMMEPYGALVDDLADAMAVDEDACFRIDGAQTLGHLRSRIEDDFGWALDIDFATPEAQARFWYVSEEKLEPRLGERRTDPGAELEQPLTMARDIAALYRSIKGQPGDRPLGEFLLANPRHRRAARRVQIAERYPYSEIRDNLLAADLVPLDLLRCKLAFFGATHFDPKSDRWLRISMFRNAPFPGELDDSDADFWIYPDIAT